MDLSLVERLKEAGILPPSENNMKLEEATELTSMFRAVGKEQKNDLRGSMNFMDKTHTMNS